MNTLQQILGYIPKMIENVLGIKKPSLEDILGVTNITTPKFGQK